MADGVERAHEHLSGRILSRHGSETIDPADLRGDEQRDRRSNQDTGLETYFTTRFSIAVRSGPCLVSHALS